VGWVDHVDEHVHLNKAAKEVKAQWSEAAGLVRIRQGLASGEIMHHQQLTPRHILSFVERCALQATVCWTCESSVSE
jgi:hypothetical protein